MCEVPIASVHSECHGDSGVGLRPVRHGIFWATVCVFAVLRNCSAAEPVAASRRAPLAPPPAFSQQVLDVFFPDARSMLGPKPQPVATTTPSKLPPGAAVVKAGQHRWSQVVSAAVLEDEVKRLAAEVAADTRTASEFKSTGQKRLRPTFSTLAVVFGVIGQFDGPVRWQAEAPGLRDECARAARNLKAASEATLREAKSRGEELAALVRGERVEVPAAEIEAPWAELVDRRALMSRLETAERDRLRPALANRATFAQQRGEVAHEAALLRLLAGVIRAEGFEYADDEAFREHADDFAARCRQLLAATEADDFEKARAALTELSKSCDRCHGDFRS